MLIILKCQKLAKLAFEATELIFNKSLKCYFWFVLVDKLLVKKLIIVCLILKSKNKIILQFLVEKAI